jgi:hypothetical protein
MVLDLVAILLRVVRHRHPLVLGSFVHSIERPDALSGALCFSGGEPSAQPGENTHTHTRQSNPVQIARNCQVLQWAIRQSRVSKSLLKLEVVPSCVYVCVRVCMCVCMCFFFRRCELVVPNDILSNVTDIWNRFNSNPTINNSTNNSMGTNPNPIDKPGSSRLEGHTAYYSRLSYLETRGMHTWSNKGKAG